MVSNIGDVYGTKWKDYQAQTFTNVPFSSEEYRLLRKEQDALMAEVLALKELLLAAKKFDEATGQPDCEMEAKVAIIRKVAEAVGVNLDEVFGPK